MPITRPTQALIIRGLITTGITLVTLVVDQVSKWWTVQLLPLGHSYPLISDWLRFTYVRNEGAAWGIFAGNQIPLAIFAIASMVAFFFFRKKIFGESRAVPYLLALLFGGIMGNLIDRIVHNYVIDMIDITIFGYPFPCFNIADSAICISVFAFILLQILTQDKA